MLLLLLPLVASAQSLAVSKPFDPATYKPLTGTERWHRWLYEDGEGAGIHIESLGAAAYDQVFQVPQTWPRNWEGFGQRTASQYGVSAIENTVHEGLGAIEGTDPRFYPCTCKGFIRRSTHVVVMSILTYNRHGHRTIDFPQIAGIYGSSMIQTLWLPPHYSPLVQGVQEGHISAGFTGAEHMIQEFAPELRRVFHLRPTFPLKSKPEDK